MSYYLLVNDNKNISETSFENTGMNRQLNREKLVVNTTFPKNTLNNVKKKNSSVSIPINIPKQIDLPTSPKIINRKSSCEKLMIESNVSKLYYSYDSVFPPHDPPPNINNFDDYCEQIWCSNTFSPGSYERYKINSYF
jgi:hypothetical protein